MLKFDILICDIIILTSI